MALGQCWARQLCEGAVMFLSGDLGAGKTTLVRGILRGLGYRGSVTSPTYTLVEPYQTNDHMAYHFDLYRLESPHELEAIGLRDMLDDHALCFFEWPERGAGSLPQPDYSVEIRHQGKCRQVRVENATGLVEMQPC